MRKNLFIQKLNKKNKKNEVDAIFWKAEGALNKHPIIQLNQQIASNKERFNHPIHILSLTGYTNVIGLTQETTSDTSMFPFYVINHAQSQ